MSEKPTPIYVEQSTVGIREVIYGDNSAESQDRAAVSFHKDSVGISGYWNGNSGEWAGEWLGADLDRDAVEHLHSFLGQWLEQTK